MPKVPIEVEFVSGDYLLDAIESHKKWLYSNGKDGVRLSLKRAGFPEIDLSGSNLSKAELIECYFNQVNLSSTNITGANLRGSNLTGSNLSRASIIDANISKTTLSQTNLKWANLTGSNLEGASLWDALLEGTVLDKCNLRGVFGLKLNNTSIRDAQFGKHAYDAYNILIEHYTGIRFLVVLILTGLALLPYFLKASFYTIVGKVQGGMQFDPNLDYQLLGQDFKTMSVGELMLGFGEDRALVSVSTALFILSYNFLRGWCTYQVSIFRQIEDRCGQSPYWNEYFPFFYLHKYVLRWMLLVAFIISAQKLFFMLTEQVTFPV